MRKTIALAACFLLSLMMFAQAGEPQYRQNRYPLVGKPYLELPLGAIKAEGWLAEMLQRQSTGMTGHLDELYPSVMGDNNGWLGGKGDMWERGPYWIDGLLPLAYLLDDSQLKAKAQRWVEAILSSQREDGFIGPQTDYPNANGLQRERALDWWPRMVVLKIMKQYYSATGDKRVIPFMTDYFHYQLATLPEKPLNHWSYWSLYRCCDNIDAVLWLYNITGDEKLLELSTLIQSQSFNFTDKLLTTDFLAHNASIHCVNLAQGMKYPAVCYQQSGDEKCLAALKKGFADMKTFNGWPNGMYGGDEALHGNNPTQGTEMCSVVEMMLSLETILQITGDNQYAEQLEKVAFNAMPTQVTDDFMGRQYFQQANQVVCSRQMRNFDWNHDGTDNVFGIFTGYTCCTANLHQGWPKFVQNLWYATPDGGAAALVYSPCSVEMKVADGVTALITEKTSYPFGETVTFNVAFREKKQRKADFAIYLRIPSWCKEPSIKINGVAAEYSVKNCMAKIYRTWQAGDVMELAVPMQVEVSRWYEESVAVERGPLIYALRIEEEWKRVEVAADERSRFGECYWEVYPRSAWNYGLISPVKPQKSFKVVLNSEKLDAKYPWNLENAPVEIHVQGKQIPSWTLYNGSAGPLPWARMSGQQETKQSKPVELTLIPYGCTTLRISEFPVIK